MEIGEILEVEGWPVGPNLDKVKVWSGEVKKVWQKKNHQFFNLEHCQYKFKFKGVVCSEKYELFYLIANTVKDWINNSFISVYPCHKLNIAYLNINGEKHIAFLCSVSDRLKNPLPTLDGMKSNEGILEKAIERFDNQKETIKKELSLCFSEVYSNKQP